jgi:sporadic carbohydrate cluster protein (TIGR04323 family)
LKKIYSYTLPRPFSNYNIPIAIQTCFIRDYCNKKNLLFSLPLTEIVKNDSYLIFKKNFCKKKIELVMTSIFVLPISNKKLFEDVVKGLNRSTNLHFVLENLVFKTATISTD